MSSVDYEEEVRSWLDLQLVSGCCSSGIVRQLAQLIEHRSGHVFQIYDEIASLEGAPHARMSGTKPSAPLTGLLVGLHRKHYSQPSFVNRNVANFVISAKFSAMSKRVLKDPEIPENRKLDSLIYNASITGYEQRSRSGKLTGEWIIYKKHRQINYYLTLGTHAEGNEQILERVLACEDEFPELALGKGSKP